MSLETGTYINSLVVTNPLGSDALADADGHLRLIKSTLKATFPNLTGPVTLTQAEINALTALASTPSGAVTYFAMSSAPSGWFVANGSAVSRTTYASLFAAIGTTYGAGDGSTTFNLPDLRGMFLRSWDAGRGLDSGRTFGSYQDTSNLSHNHGVSDPGHNHNTSPFLGSINFSRAGFDPGGLAFLTSEAGGGPGYVTTQGTNISIGASGGNESRPRNIAMLACIKA